MEEQLAHEGQSSKAARTGTITDAQRLQQRLVDITQALAIFQARLTAFEQKKATEEKALREELAKADRALAAVQARLVALKPALALVTEFPPPKTGARKHNILIVAHLAAKIMYGAERSLLEVIQCFDPNKFNLFCVFPASSPPLFDKLRGHCQEIITLRYQWTKGLHFSPQTIEKFRDLMTTRGIDLVYVNTVMLREPLLAAQSLHIPGVVHVREIIDKDPALTEVIGLPTDSIVENLKSSADYIIANSEATRQLFNKGVATFLVYNGIDTEELNLQAPAPNARLRVGLISSNRPKKGIYDFVKLAQLAYPRFPHMDFFLIGEKNRYISDLEKEQRQGRWTPNLYFLEYQPNPLDCYKSLDVVVNFSHFAESFGRTVAEAMACRRPVISYEWGALPEIVSHGQSGYLIPYLHYERALAYLEQLDQNRHLLRELGTQGRERVVQHFSLSTLRTKLNGVFDAMLSRQVEAVPPLLSPPLVNGDRSQPPTTTRHTTSDETEEICSSGQHPEPHLADNLKSRQEKLRIAYFLWHFPVPSETFVLNELRYLVHHGYDVKVYCRQSPHKDFTPDFPIAYTQVKTPDDLAHLLTLHQRNVVHSHFVYPTVTEFVLPTCEKAHLPFTFIAHGQDIFRYENMKRNRIGAVVSSPWCLRVFVPGRFHREFLIEQGVPSGKIVINPQGVDVEGFTNGQANAERVYNRKMAVCAIQRFVEKKGLDILIRAGKLLQDTGITINLYGYGPLAEQFRQLIQTEQVANVHLQGALRGDEAVRNALLDHDLFVSPSIRATDGDMDGIPTTLMEAMSVHLPVLTTPLSSIPDLVQHDVTGFHCPPNDPDALANAIRRFYELHPEKIRTITIHAKALVQQKYAIDRCLKTLLRVWRRDAIDVVLVTYNNLAGVREVIRRLYTYTPTYFNLIVVDNNSSEEVVSYLNTLARTAGNVTFLPLQKNIFVGPGTNLAVEHSHQPYIVYLCSKEAFVTNFGWDQHMMNYMDENPTVGMAGLLGYSPSYLTGQMYQTNLARFSEFRNQEFAEQHPSRLFRHVQGGLFILRRAMYEQIGGFSEKIPHNYTDVEYSYYAESCGWKLGDIPHVLSLYAKTRPPLEARFDEYVLAVHPPTLESGSALDRIIERTVKTCTVCGWMGTEFLPSPGDRRACPQCQSLDHHRTLYAFLAGSLLCYRQLKCLYIDPQPILEPILRKLFSCRVLPLDEAEKELAAGSIRNATAGMDIVILSHALHRVSDDRKLLSEVQRLLKPEATLLLQSPYEGQQNREFPLSSEGAKRTYCLSGLHQMLHESGFDTVTTPLYPSGVVGYDWFQLFHCVKRRGRPA